MGFEYIVQQGDYLSQIARDHGFSDYRTIWDHPDNQALKLKRKNPNVLLPGDVLVIPDRDLKQQPCATEKRHRFKTQGPGLRLRLVLEDVYKKPIENAKCVLEVENHSDYVTTDGDGRIDYPLPPNAKRASLVIQDAQTPYDSVPIPIKIGHLDPVEELSGQQSRLNNLGYFPGTASEYDEPFRSAVEEFQCDHGLAVDGICGPNTQAKLKEVHGC
jgi:N-acetylmuramoyl-L-alanine amidase